MGLLSKTHFHGLIKRRQGHMTYDFSTIMDRGGRDALAVDTIGTTNHALDILRKSIQDE